MDKEITNYAEELKLAGYPQEKRDGEIKGGVYAPTYSEIITECQQPFIGITDIDREKNIWAVISSATNEIFTGTPEEGATKLYLTLKQK